MPEETDTLEAPQVEDQQEQGPGTPALDEGSRKKLDTIVSKMHDNGESDDNIKTVVEDFKKKYSSSPTPQVTQPIDLKANATQKQPTEAVSPPIQSPKKLTASVEDAENRVKDILTGDKGKKAAASITMDTRNQAFDQMRQGAVATQDATAIARIPLARLKSDEDTDVNGYMSNLDDTKARDILQRTAHLNPTEKQNIEHSAYLLDTKDNETAQRETNLKGIESGKYNYDIKNKRVIQPLDAMESVMYGFNQRQKAFDDYDFLTSASKQDVIDRAEKEAHDHDPDKPIPTPANWGSLTAPIGSEGIPMAKMAIASTVLGATGAEAGVPLAVSAIAGREYYPRAYAESFWQHYHENRSKGLDESASYDKASETADFDAKIAAAQMAATSVIGGRIGLHETPNIEFTPGLKNVVNTLMEKGSAFTKNAIKENIANVVPAAGGQMAKNIHEGKPIMDGVLDEAASLAAFTTAMGVSIGALHGVVSGKAGRIANMALAKVPDEALNAHIDDLLRTNHITKDDAENLKASILQTKELDAKIPPNVKDEETRINLQDKVKRLGDLEAQKKTLAKPFQEEVQAKIDRTTEDINNIVSESKQSKTKENEQPTTTGVGTEVPGSEGEIKPTTGSEEPGGVGSIDREEKIRSEEDGEHVSGGEVIDVAPHGETKGDEQGKISGQTSEPLTEQGRKSAGETADQFAKDWKDTPEEKRTIITSPRERATETADIISKKTGAKVETNDKLDTWDVKDFNGVKEAEFKPVEDWFAKHPDETAYDGPDEKFKGKEIGESLNQLGERVADAHKEITEGSPDAKVVTHGYVRKVLAAVEKAGDWNDEARKIYEGTEKPEDIELKTAEATERPTEPAPKITKREDLAAEIRKVRKPRSQKVEVSSETHPEEAAKMYEGSAARLREQGDVEGANKLDEAAKNLHNEKREYARKNSFRDYNKKYPEDDIDQYSVTRGSKPMDKLSEGSIDVNGKPNSVEQYVDKAKAVLKQLFPDHEIKPYETEAEYSEKEQRPEGSAGVYQPDKKYIALNLERIRNSGIENTVFHEVIHPIVKEAMESRPGAIDSAYSKLVEMKDVKGMENVWEHEELYRGRGANIMKVEAVTEFLTHVADGNIDPAKFSTSIRTKIVDVINRIFKALGIDKVISTAQDVRRLADSIKSAFEKADAKPVEEALGKRGETTKGEALESLKPEDDEERAIKKILQRTDLPDEDVKAELLNAGYDEATVDKVMGATKEEQNKGPKQLIEEALAQGKEYKKNRQIAPADKTAIAKKSLGKTLKRWFYDSQDEVTDVKSIIRQRKGEEEFEIDKLYKATNKLRDYWNTVKKTDQLQFILGMERPDLLKNMSQDVKDMADGYRQRLDKTFDTIKSALPNINFLEDYFPHFWNKPDEVRNFFAGTLGKAPLEGSKSFAKERFFDTILDGLKRDYELTTTNPEELTRLAEANAWKFKTARNVFDDMKRLGYLKFSTAKDVPSDWATVNDKLFNKIGAYVDKSGDANITKGSYMMPPEVAKLMNDYLSLGIKSPIRNVVQKYNNIKNLFQLGVGAYHFSTTALENLITGNTIGIQDLSRGNILGGVKNIVSSSTIIPGMVQSLRRGFRAINDYHKGNVTDDVQNLINANAKIGRQKMYSLDTWYNTKKAFGQLRADGDFKKIPKLAWNALLTLPEAINKPLMEHWVPALKVGGYLRSLDAEIKSRSLTDPRAIQQAKEKIWDSMDDRLGQVVYDNIFVNKAAKDLAFMGIRSAGWTGGTIRAVSKGIGEIPLSISRLAKGQGLSQRTAYLMALPLTVGFFGGAYHYLMTGNQPEELKDYFFPKDGTKNPDGTDHRVTLPSYMKDILAYSKSPAQTLMHKTSPLLNDITEIYQNKDFYSEKIYNEDDPFYQKGLDILKHEGETMVPFSFRQRPGEDKPIAEQFGTTQGLEQKFGIMQAPRERERTDTQNAIVKAYSAQIGDESGKTHEQMEQQIARKHLREFLFNGGEWKNADPDLVKASNLKSVPEFIQQAKMNPYERYFRGLKNETKQKIFDDMTVEEQKQYRRYMHAAGTPKVTEWKP